MGCNTSTPTATTDRSPKDMEMTPKAIIEEMFSHWFAGNYLKDPSLASKYISESTVIDFSADCKNPLAQNLYKKYTGPAEFNTWIQTLMMFDFPDFSYELSVDSPASSIVTVSNKYTPTCKYTGKTLDHQVEDIQEWGFKNGKVSSFKVKFGDVPAVDGLCEMNAAQLKVFGILNTWGTGAYYGPDADKNIAADFSEDCLFLLKPDDYDFKNSDGFKTYTGHAGIKDYLNFIATNMDFPDFTLESILPADDESNKVLMSISYSPVVKMTGKTGERVTDVSEYSIVDGKCVRFKQKWSNPAANDALFEMNDVQKRVLGMFATWGSGGYAGEDGPKKIREDFSADLKTLAKPDNYVMKNTDGYQNYEGPEGVQTWLNFLQGIDFPDFTVVSCIASDEDPSKVTLTATSTPTVKSTGKTAKKTFTDTHLWQVKDGKAVSVKFLWGDAAAMDELFKA